MVSETINNKIKELARSTSEELTSFNEKGTYSSFIDQTIDFLLLLLVNLEVDRKGILLELLKKSNLLEQNQAPYSHCRVCCSKDN